MMLYPFNCFRISVPDPAYDIRIDSGKDARLEWAMAVGQKCNDLFVNFRQRRGNVIDLALNVVPLRLCVLCRCELFSIPAAAHGNARAVCQNVDDRSTYLVN